MGKTCLSLLCVIFLIGLQSSASGQDASKQGAWIGVDLEIPHPSLSAQLGLEGQGLVVTNVCDDGPAHQAGVLQYDVLLKLDDEPIQSDVNFLRKLLTRAATHGPLSLTLLRSGQLQTIELHPSQAPHEGCAQWVHIPESTGIVRTTHDIGGKIYHLQEGGDIIVKKLESAEFPRELQWLLKDALISEFQNRHRYRLTEDEIAIMHEKLMKENRRVKELLEAGKMKFEDVQSTLEEEMGKAWESVVGEGRGELSHTWFVRNEKGEIVVTIGHGRTVLEQVFADEGDLQVRNPKFFERYLQAKTSRKVIHESSRVVDSPKNMKSKSEEN